MNKTILIGLAAMLLLAVPALAAMDRVVSSTTVGPSGTFTVRYAVSGVSAPYFYSIKDVLSGGCTVQGGTVIATTLTSPQAETGEISIQAPSSGSCTLTGDSKYGADAIVAFPDATITVTPGGDDSGDTPTDGISGMTIGIIAAVIIGAFWLLSKK